MSMLSAQCDELRAMAESVGLAVPQAATLMMEAADTIWELRDSVHRERAEADRLREELEAVGMAAYSYGRGDLKAENAKLRELASGMYGMLATFDAILGNHDACETPRPLIFGENKSFKDAMRELGIELNDCE